MKYRNHPTPRNLMIECASKQGNLKQNPKEEEALEKTCHFANCLNVMKFNEYAIESKQEPRKLPFKILWTP